MTAEELAGMLGVHGQQGDESDSDSDDEIDTDDSNIFPMPTSSPPPGA